jgi:hypothetical protein
MMSNPGKVGRYGFLIFKFEYYERILIDLQKGF